MKGLSAKTAFFMLLPVTHDYLNEKKIIAEKPKIKSVD